MPRPKTIKLAINLKKGKFHMENKVKKARKSVSGKLLKIVIPMIAISIIVIMLIVATQARSIIVELAENNLEKESEYYTEKTKKRILVQDTDIGKGLQKQIDDLKDLLKAFERGLIREKN